MITVWEYLSTANVGGDPDVVSEMLHRDPPAPALAQKNLRAGGAGQGCGDGKPKDVAVRAVI
jgi:hypothetical protein